MTVYFSRSTFSIKKRNFLFLVKIVKAVVACQAPWIQLLALWIHDFTEVGWGCSMKPHCSFLCSDTSAVGRDLGTKLLLSSPCGLVLAVRSGDSGTEPGRGPGSYAAMQNLKDIVIIQQSMWGMNEH